MDSINVNKTTSNEVSPKSTPVRCEYSVDQKLAAVLSVTEDGLTYKAAAKEHDIASVSTLKKWLIAYRREGESALQPKPMGRPKGIHTPAPRSMVGIDEMLLRMENGRLFRKLGR
ncbi:MAG: transposase [Raoultibacter sp.]